MAMASLRRCFLTPLTPLNRLVRVHRFALQVAEARAVGPHNPALAG